jgi:hypothetical protein
MGRGEGQLFVSVIGFGGSVFRHVSLDQLGAALAGIFLVDDPGSEDAGDIESMGKGGISPEGDGDFTGQIDAGRECAQSFHLDASPGAVELDDVTADLLDGLVDRSFDQAS